MLIYFVFTYIKPSISMIFISLVIFITIMDSSIYMIQLIFNLIQSNTQAFIVRQLGPTMLLNLVFFILLAYPIQKMIKNRDYL
ncbi:MAG: rod shape-determining protein MreD, partial [Vagococcus sp.]|nr:rod shape-determining protein MreD [Vagococcus sp.]